MRKNLEVRKYLTGLYSANSKAELTDLPWPEQNLCNQSQGRTK